MGRFQHIPSGVPTSGAPGCRADLGPRPGSCRQACPPAGLLAALLTWVPGPACVIAFLRLPSSPSPLEGVLKHSPPRGVAPSLHLLEAECLCPGDHLLPFVSGWTSGFFTFII